jgi:glycosyltransferase involved in cell wall biosynthesis
VGKPLVVDFRDVWVADSTDRSLVTRFKRRLEAMVVGACDHLILNTAESERIYRSAFPQHASKISHINNGFDSINVPDGSETTAVFRIVHAGMFYARRRPDLLLNALVECELENVELVHVGNYDDTLAAYGDRLRIVQLGPKSRREVNAILRTASLLYLKQEFSQASATPIAAKTFDYLATGIPILVEGPPGENVRIVEEYASRAFVVAEDSLQLMKETLRIAYETSRSTKRVVSATFRQIYSRENLTARLAAIFSQVTKPD